MTQFAFERWDESRLIVNRDYLSLLRTHKLDNFETFMRSDLGNVAKHQRLERSTYRLLLEENTGRPIELYIKQHRAAPWKEYIKPWLRLRRPILGARHEWDAIGHFHRAGIPTMVPVAVGEWRGESFLVTRGIEQCCKVSDWMDARYGLVPQTPADDSETLSLLHRIADLARRMHQAGLHHQDFYLNHLLMRTGHPRYDLYIIDLGRACRRERLSQYWIVKDLAQLFYSARMLPRWMRLHFLEHYFNRSLTREDSRLLGRIESKMARIARHGRKHAA